MRGRGRKGLCCCPGWTPLCPVSVPQGPVVTLAAGPVASVRNGYGYSSGASLPPLHSTPAGLARRCSRWDPPRTTSGCWRAAASRAGACLECPSAFPLTSWGQGALASQLDSFQPVCCGTSAVIALAQCCEWAPCSVLCTAASTLRRAPPQARHTWLPCRLTCRCP